MKCESSYPGIQRSTLMILLVNQRFSNPAGLCSSTRLHFPDAALVPFGFLPSQILPLFPRFQCHLLQKAFPDLLFQGNKCLALLSLGFCLYFTRFPGLSPLFLLDYKFRGAALPGSVRSSSLLFQCKRRPYSGTVRTSGSTCIPSRRHLSLPGKRRQSRPASAGGF